MLNSHQVKDKLKERGKKAINVFVERTVQYPRSSQPKEKKKSKA
jgi:hypothetical protein